MFVGCALPGASVVFITSGALLSLLNMTLLIARKMRNGINEIAKFRTMHAAKTTKAAR